MRSLNFSIPRAAAALAVAGSLAFPLIASAQQQPYGDQSYGQQPSYAQPPNYGYQQSVKGTISGFDGQWIVYVHDDKGYTDHVTLHQGTIINPTGIKLLEGMRVTVYGSPQGSTFGADRIDVAYSPYSPYYGSNGEPAYGYGDNNGYGYGGYGYGYGYGGYPYFGIGINWGWGWGWGWPGYWGWGWPAYWGFGGYCCGYYGYPYYGYPYYPFRPFRGRGFVPVRHGTIGAPVHGSMSGGTRAPVTSGGMRSGGGMRVPVSGGMHGRPPR
jgi:hypothetical protein